MHHARWIASSRRVILWEASVRVLVPCVRCLVRKKRWHVFHGPQRNGFVAGPRFESYSRISNRGCLFVSSKEGFVDGSCAVPHVWFLPHPRTHSFPSIVEERYRIWDDERVHPPPLPQLSTTHAPIAVLALPPRNLERWTAPSWQTVWIRWMRSRHTNVPVCIDRSTSSTSCETPHVDQSNPRTYTPGEGSDTPPTVRILHGTRPRTPAPPPLHGTSRPTTRNNTVRRESETSNRNKWSKWEKRSRPNPTC